MMDDNRSKNHCEFNDLPPELLHQHINIKLAAMGEPCGIDEPDAEHACLYIADSLIKRYSRQRRLLSDYRCPADQRIQDFLNSYLKEHDIEQFIELPGTTFILDKPGVARAASLPLNGNHFHSDLLDSYRLLQGVLHNPKSDRRTTKGVFHIAAGGLPVPTDKLEVPVPVFARLLEAALNPPQELLLLPATSLYSKQAHVWASLLVRPAVRPAVAKLIPTKSMEVRLFAPGSLIANLDFVESIFGNAGDPYLPENDAALDIEHWTGQSGCIILAPHLVGLSKKQLGLLHYDEASERQRRDGMCWSDAEELYNDGQAFKLVCRDKRGVIVTIIADNYFGYSKKEIKSQISYAANLYGGCEEEHAGGALAFPRFNLGEVYIPRDSDMVANRTFTDLCQRMAANIKVKKTGYAVDLHYDDIIYLQENARIDMRHQSVSWENSTGPVQIKLMATHTYIYPSGFRVYMQRDPHAPVWRLVGTREEGTFCHKPSTVSGGGKSEISKSIAGALISGSLYVADYEKDMKQVRAIFERDYHDRFRDPNAQELDNRSLLSNERSLGSVIKLLTPSANEYTDVYNQWLETIPHHILAIVFMIKRYYRTAWGKDWHTHFSVDTVNGAPGHELRYQGRKLTANYLRVGFGEDGNWRLFKLRQDFVAADKIQMEDDITVSTVLPAARISGLNPEYKHPCVKITANCEKRLFQRPDEAINRGSDRQTESDLSGSNSFISNFEPMQRKHARKLIEDVVAFDAYSAPMQELINSAAQMDADEYFISSAHPRIVNGEASLNVRYLQDRPDLANPRASYLAETCTRLHRGLEPEQSLCFPVNAVLAGRRNNPPEPGIRPLAVYNPIHYQELPELFMDFICSLTGKSPSTTGAGSEGALTKGPFNSLSATADLNTALVSFMLCGYDGFSTAAGFIGHRRIDHDISMLIPEIWCRLPVECHDARYMIEHSYLEKLEDFEYQGRRVLASRLGYRITDRILHDHFGKMFDKPMAVFDEAMLRPESQDMATFVDGIENICEAQQRVAHNYFTDGSVDDACPPLKALLHIMAHGHYEGKTLHDPLIRDMFTRETLLQSDWYRERLTIKQCRDKRRWLKLQEHLGNQLNQLDEDESDMRMHLNKQLARAEQMLELVSGGSYIQQLQGTLGADWIHHEA